MFSVLLLAPIVFLAQLPNVDFSGTSHDPDRVAWLTRNAIPIRTVEPNDPDVSDLRPLQKSIGALRFVSLGGSFGSPNAGKVKARLLRFLHEEMGFDLMVCSAPVYDAEILDRVLDTTKSLPINFDQSLAACFGPGPVPTREILNYVHATRSTAHPLHLAGIGSTPTLYEAEHYGKALFAAVDHIDPSIGSPAERRAVKQFFGSFLVPGVPGGFSQINYRQVSAAITHIYEQLSSRTEDTTKSREILLHLQALANSLDRFPGPPAYRSGETNPLRWVADVWAPNAKAVIWAKSYPAPDRIIVDIGWYHDPAKEFGDAIYSITVDEIGFRPGGPAALAARDNQPAVDNLERLVHATGRPFNFIDFRGLPKGHWLHDLLEANLGLDHDISDWPAQFDSILMLDPSLAKKQK